MALTDKIQALLEEVKDLVATNEAELEELRLKYLSRKGIINDLMAEFREVPNEQKRAVGVQINELKSSLQERFNVLKQALNKHEEVDPTLDLSRTPYPISLGSRHPLSLVKNEIVAIFARLGFTVATGPEIEDDWHVFSSLNFADDHPARDMQDTFYIDENIVLRSQTSPVQIRTMEKKEGKVPVKIICPGRVYRKDDDATHSPMFHQIEGLVIGEEITMADLKGTLLHFVREIFEKEVQLRLRPSYFPFTEPSAEVDISCVSCGGEGCRVCSHTGWLEILGAGMVHPNVLRAGGYDPSKVRGFAFGMGVERIAMLKYGINDLRLLFANDIRTLKQF